MTKLERNIKKCTGSSYDLIIVGGGIYGVMLSYEAARRNLRSLLLEKNDFSGATSLNHLRTVHGGLRYLQSLDLHRFRESVGERRWFLRHFPQYVNIMPCLMPLYNKGLHRRAIMWAALKMNDTFSFTRNRQVGKERHLPNGKIISAKKTQALFPAVDTQGLKGAAVWYDANIQEYQRLMMEVLKLAVTSGAEALNYVEATELLKDNNQVTGVRAVDRETGETYQFQASMVINAAGPWSRDVATRFDKDHEPLFKKRLLLWNVLFDKEALSGHSLAVTPIKGGGHVYFFHPWKNRLLVGTGEVVVEKREKSDKETTVPPGDMEQFINDMNTMLPDLKLTENNIQRVYSGILPAKDNGRLANRETIYNHSAEGGPNGLISISGVKFTTSRLVAHNTLNLVFPNAQAIPHHTLMSRMPAGEFSYDFDWEPTSDEDFRRLKEIVDNEAVVHLEDLLLRRTSLADNPRRPKRLLESLRPLFPWDDAKWEKETAGILAG